MGLLKYAGQIIKDVAVLLNKVSLDGGSCTGFWKMFNLLER